MFLTTLVLLVASLLFFPQVYVLGFVKIQYSKSKWPKLYIVPTRRQIEAPQENIKLYPEISYHGLRFKNPYGKIVKKEQDKHKVSPHLFIRFQRNSYLFVYENPIDYLSSVHKTGHDFTKTFQDAYGKKNLNSNYRYFKLILSTSPDQIHMLTPVHVAMAKQMLLTLKIIGMPLPLAYYGMYFFEEQNITGFQFGSPEGGKPVLLEIYDPNDHQYHITVEGETITQKQIDIMLHTARVTQ